MDTKLIISIFSLSSLLCVCIFTFTDNGEWKEKYRNCSDKIKGVIIEVASFKESESRYIPKDIKYFTYEANWMAATLGPHEYLYFSIEVEKATTLVDYVFSLVEVR